MFSPMGSSSVNSMNPARLSAMKWCCADFEGHLLKENTGVGLLYYYRSRVGPTVFVSNRDEGVTLSKPAFAIRCCPFCGRNLREWFASQEERSAPTSESDE